MLCFFFISKVPITWLIFIGAKERMGCATIKRIISEINGATCQKRLAYISTITPSINSKNQSSYPAAIRWSINDSMTSHVRVHSSGFFFLLCFSYGSLNVKPTSWLAHVGWLLVTNEAIQLVIPIGIVSFEYSCQGSEELCIIHVCN